MDRNGDLKRKSRNLNEKKRRDQFNILINELNNLIDPLLNDHNFEDDDESILSGNRIPGSRTYYDPTTNYQQHPESASFLKEDCDDSLFDSRGQNSLYRSRYDSNGKFKVSSSASSIPGSMTKQRSKMDKSSVLKYAMEFLKKHSHQANNDDNQQSCDEDSRKNGQYQKPLATSRWKPPYITDDEFSVQMLEALNAFIVVCEVSPEARIIYSSDNLTDLLNYTGTCNSLRHYDYVSLFDIISPFDKPLIEKVFRQQANVNNQTIDEKLQQQHQQENSDIPSNTCYVDTSTDNHDSFLNNDEKDANNCPNDEAISESLSSTNQNQYISLSVKFRTGLNLTEIKQKRLQRQRNNNLQVSNANQKKLSHTELSNQQSQPQSQFQATHLQQQQQQQQQQQKQQQGQEEEPIHQYRSDKEQLQSERDINMQVDSRNELANCGDNEEQRRRQLIMDQEIYFQIVNEHHPRRSQQSIAEQQQQLLSDGLREQQEYNHHKQKQQRQGIQSMQMGNKQVNHTNDQLNNSNGFNNTSISDDADQKTKRPLVDSISENDQPLSTGSDDASDSNQPPSASKPERRVHHRYQNHHGNYRGQNCHHKRQKQAASASSRQQYELVRLMATFKSLDDNMPSEHTCYSRYKFEEPPPAENRYFICIGRLDAHRLSYDLKIIVPPLRGGTNVFLNNQFLSKYTLKWRFLWVDNRAPSIIGYLPFEVLGTSGYDYYHWDDLDKLVISHEGLMRDGQASSGPYRFLTKGQQWIWLQTKYCIVSKNHFKFVHCTHTVIGFEESDGYVSSSAPMEYNQVNVQEQTTSVLKA